METTAVKIKLKENTEPYCLMTARAVVFPIMPAVKEELQRMKANGVLKITKTAILTGVPPWLLWRSLLVLLGCMSTSRSLTGVKRAHLMLPNLKDFAPILP